MYKQIVKIIYRTVLGLVLLCSILALFVVLPIKPKINPLVKIGVTFSPRAAEYLGLDWKSVYKDMLDNISPDIIRLPAYWNVLEPDDNQYNWEQLDFLVNELEGKDIEIIMAVGHKVPRWPECHIPDWVEGLPEDEIEEQLFEMVEKVVKRYRGNSQIISWQVENESLFAFGECPKWSSDRGRLKRLIKLVRELAPEDRVTTSDSGELSFWLRTATLPIDSLNISLYRAVYNERLGFMYWPVNPYFYKLHAALISPFVNEITISELQMEPWGSDDVDKLSNEEIYKSFSPHEFNDRIDFARRTGATTVLTWGVEWWYYMKDIRGNSEYFDQAVELFQD